MFCFISLNWKGSVFVKKLIIIKLTNLGGMVLVFYEAILKRTISE